MEEEEPNSPSRVDTEAKMEEQQRETEARNEVQESQHGGTAGDSLTGEPSLAVDGGVDEGGGEELEQENPPVVVGEGDSGGGEVEELPEAEMEDKTDAAAATSSLADIADETEVIPDGKEIAEVASFTGILPRDNEVASGKLPVSGEGGGSKDLIDGEKREEIEVEEGVLDGEKKEDADVGVKGDVSDVEREDVDADVKGVLDWEKREDVDAGGKGDGLNVEKSEGDNVDVKEGVLDGEKRDEANVDEIEGVFGGEKREEDDADVKEGVLYGEEREKVDVAVRGVLDGEQREEVDVNVKGLMDGEGSKLGESDMGTRAEEGDGDLVESTDVDVIEKENKLEDAVVAGIVEEKDFAEDRVSAIVGQLVDEMGIQQETVMADVKEEAESAEEMEKAEEKLVNEVVEEAEMSAKDKAQRGEEDNKMADVEGVAEMAEEMGMVEEKQMAGGVEEAEMRAKDEGRSEDHEIADVADGAGNVEEKRVTEVLEEKEMRTEDKAQKVEDVDMDEGAEEMETQEDSLVADVAVRPETLGEEDGIAERKEAQEETVMADVGEEEPEETDEVEEVSKSVGGKRKRGKNSKDPKGSGKKKEEEDVCFICFDGGELVLCDRRGCPKAYHPSCVGRDEAFFQSKGKWNCGWHLCSKCEKTAFYMCYTCTFSLCKGCIKNAVIFSVRGNKGFCETCMETVKLIESNEPEKKEAAKLDFDDKSSWEYLFKDYWIDMKTRLSITSEELARAKNPWKGYDSHGNKLESPNKLGYANDGGGSDSESPKRRKTRRQSKSGSTEADSRSSIRSARSKGSLSGDNVEWASKELLEVVSHMRNGDRSFLPQSEVHNILLEYIKRYNLRDPRRKSQVICDSRLQNLFGKSHVGHFEMLNLLDSHFLIKEDSQVDDLKGRVVDMDASHLDADDDVDALTKTNKDKKRKTRRRGDNKGRQSNLDDYAAIDMHNINLIYLRRNLVEDLIEDPTTFRDKVVGAFVRLRISGNQKQDLYRLVQVVGTNKVAEPYKVGKKTTDFLLEILNLNKTEMVSIDIISNQDFTEDECKRLRQSIKCGLINRLTVGDIQEKAIALQEVKVKNWLEGEILRLSHLRDRASDMGRRKELRECVEKLQVLKSPEERQRRLEEIPEVHADPSMDPNCESEDEEEPEEKEQDNHLRPRGTGFSRRGREPISPRKGGFGSSDSWTGTRNYSSMNRELSRNYSGKGFSGKGDHAIVSDERANENPWSSGRDREIQPINSEKPRSVSFSEASARNAHSVAMPEPSSRVQVELSAARPPSTATTQAVPQINESEKMWHYKDPSGKIQGPFSMVQLRKWSNTGYFPADLRIWKTAEKQEDSILLTDALAGKFQKQTPLVENNTLKTQMPLYSSRTLGSSGQSAGESWKSQPEFSSSAGRAATPPPLEIPKHTQDSWNSGTNLPSPTPNQTPNPTKRRTFESRWSPTPVQPSGTPAVASSNLSHALSSAAKPEISMLLNSGGATQMQPQTMMPGESHRSQVNPLQLPTSTSTNAPMSHPGSIVTLPSPTPAGGNQGWVGAHFQKLDSGNSIARPTQIPAHGRWGDASSSSQNCSPSFGAANPSGVLPQGQSGFPQSDSWRLPALSQSNVQTAAPPNLPWGMNMTNNQSNTPTPGLANQSSGWGPMPVNQNMGWGEPVQAGTNMNWGSSVPVPKQGNTNAGWGATGQGQAQGYSNPGWGISGQAPVSGNTASGWMQPGQGPQPVNGNQGWAGPNQGPHLGNSNPSGAAPPGNQSYWGNQQNQNGDRISNQRDGGSHGGESGYGGGNAWSRQSSFGSGGGGGGGGGGSSFKGQRVCKFFRENGYCKKGASCDYMHN